MTRNTRNPFEYGGVVSGEGFCNREKERADLSSAIRNREKLFVFSERRFGKTSLIRSVLAHLPRKRTLAAYIDLWQFFSSLAPSVTVNEEGRPEISFGVTRRGHLSAALDEVLETPARIAAKGEQDVVIVFDEFQQILEYGDDRVEKSSAASSRTTKTSHTFFLAAGST